MHLEWARDGASGANAPAAPAANRTAPEGTVTADGGGGGAETRAKLGAAPALAASEASPTRGAAGTVTASACAPGFAGLLCAPCLPGTYKEGTGNGACSPCAPIPRRAVFVDPARGAPGAGGATSRACPYECVGGGERLVFPACATRAEAAVAAVGGPAAAGAALAAVVLCAALPLAAVVGRARAAERRALGRGGGRRAPQRFGSGFFPDGSRLARGAFASASAASGLATPFLRRSRDSPRAGGSGSGSTADGDAGGAGGEGVPGAFLGRVYFSGANAFGDPWRLPPTPPPAVQPLLHAEEWARLVRACATGAPASWGAGQRSSQRARFPETRGSPRPGDPDETRREAVRRFGGASRARWRGAVDAILGALFAPGQTWWRERERRRVAACLDTLLDAYDRRCLRSARARALQEGLAFGCSDDARVAWLDFFAQGDEEDAFPSFPTSSAEASAEDRGASREAKRQGEELTNVTALTEHLPLAVVFSGEGTFQAPWRWETAPETAADEGLPAAALRRAVPPATLAVAGREVRAALRRCHRVERVPTAADTVLSQGVRRRVERRRGRGGGGGASFAFADGDVPDFDVPGPGPAAAPPPARARVERSDVFARVDGADALARVLETSVNEKLRPHGVALALAAFEPPEDDPFGGFSLGLLGVSAEALFDVPEEDGAFFARPDFGDLGPNDARLTGNATNSDEDVSSDAERAPFLVRAEETSQGLETLETQPGSFVETAVRGAAAWAMAAATSTSPARAESDHFQSLRSLAAPRARDGRGAPRLTPRARRPSKSSKSSKSSKETPGRGTHDANDGIGQRNGGRNASAPRAETAAAAAAGAALAAAPLGTVLYAPRAAGAFGDTIERKERRRITLERGLIRTWFRLASMPSPSPRASRARLAAALGSAALVAADAAASFAVLAQTLECDGGARLALVLSSPLLALPLAPIAGAVALCLAALGPAAGGSTYAESARAARAYAAWTMDAVAAVAVAFAATALARSGVDALGSRCGDLGGRFGGALSADGAAWFAPPLAAAVVKLAAAAAAAARAADLDEKEEEASADAGVHGEVS